jgi:hypothetical protein
MCGVNNILQFGILGTLLVVCWINYSFLVDHKESAIVKNLRQEDIENMERQNRIREEYGSALVDFSESVGKRAVLGAIEYADLNEEMNEFNKLLRNLTKQWGQAASKIQFAIKQTIGLSRDFKFLFSEDEPISATNRTETVSNIMRVLKQSNNIDAVISNLLKKYELLRKKWVAGRKSFIKALEINIYVVEESYRKAETMRLNVERYKTPKTILSHIKNHLIPGLLVGIPTFYAGWLVYAVPIVTGYTVVTEVVDTYIHLPQKIVVMESFKTNFNTIGDYLNSVTYYIDFEISAQTMMIEALTQLFYDIESLKTPGEKREMFINIFLQSLRDIEEQAKKMCENNKKKFSATKHIPIDK